MAKRTATKFTGVYERVATGRMHNGKPDICYDIAYQVHGKLTWEKVGWKSEGYDPKLASFVRAERIRAIRHGEELPQEKKSIPFFRDLAKDYLEWAKTHRTREGSDEANRYKNHLSPFFDSKRVDEITPFMVKKFKLELEKKGLADGTIKHCLSIFRDIWNHANLNIPLPIKKGTIPNPKNARERFFSYDEAKRLLEEIKKRSKQFHDMCLLSLLTGLRHKEITGIRGRDISWDHNIINVTDPKNDETDIVYLTPEVRELLSQYKHIPKDELIFKTKKGKRIREVSDTFSKVIDLLGFNKGVTDRRYKLTFHSLRHTYASWLALQGTQLQVIQQLMRHKDVSQTIRYAHLMPDQKKKAAEELTKTFKDKI